MEQVPFDEFFPWTSDRNANEKNSSSYFVDNIWREPRKYNFFGMVCIFSSVLALFFVFAFSSGTALQRILVTIFSGISAFGGFCVFMNAVATAPQRPLVGTLLFFSGLILFFISSTIQLGIPFSVAAAVIGLIGMLLIILGLVFLFWQGILDYKSPVFAVHNLVLPGSLLFACGAAGFFCSNIRAFPSLATFASPGLEAFSALFASIGALMFVVLAARSFGNFETITTFQSKSTVVFANEYMLALVCSWGKLCQVVGILIACSSFLLGSSAESLWLCFAGFAFTCISSLVCFIVSAKVLYKHSILLLLVNGFFSVVSVLTCIWINPQIFINQPLRGVFEFAISLVEFCSFIAEMIEALRSFRRPIISFANTHFVSALFTVSRAVLLLVDGIYVITASASNSGLIAGWLLFLALEKSTEVIFLGICAEVALSKSFADTSFDLQQDVGNELKKSKDWGKITDFGKSFDVLIVGGGPAGLMLACELGRRKISVLLVEQRTSIVPDSRFLLINAATMESLKRNPEVEIILKQGQPTNVPWGATFSSGMCHEGVQTFFEVRAPCRDVLEEYGSDGESIWMSRCCSSLWTASHSQRVVQSVQEAALYRAASELETVELRFGWRFVDFYISDEMVHSKICPIDDENEVWSVASKFIAGCDGPTSRVAELCDLRFDGFVKVHSMRSLYFKSEELLRGIQGTVGIHHQYHVVRKGVGVGMFVLVQAKASLFTFHLFALYDGRRPGDLPEEEIPSMLQEFVGPNVNFEIITKGRWMWNFTVARAFELQQKIFFAGDSCHSWPPFGGMGGNTAYQDAMNLAWKLSAAVKGWAGPELLRSYGLERREQVLRIAMSVMAMTPEPGRLGIMGKVIWIKLLSWIAKSKWLYANSGHHAANHYAISGIMLGLRYNFSPILAGVPEHLDQNESTPSYTPKLIPGGRLLHVRLEDGSSIQDSLERDGFTIFLSDEKISNFSSDLLNAFQSLGVPAKELNFASQLRNVSGTKNKRAGRVWEKAGIVISRPDLYVCWTYETGQAISAKSVAQIVSGRCNSSSQHITSGLLWLAARFVQEIRPLRHLFPHAVFLFDQSKSSELKKMTAKQEIVSDEAVVVGSDGQEQLYEIKLLGRPSRRLHLCHHCQKPLEDSTSITFNEAVLHADCLYLFRKEKLTSACAHCGGGFLDSSSRVTLNDYLVHANCLVAFKKSLKLND